MSSLWLLSVDQVTRKPPSRVKRTVPVYDTKTCPCGKQFQYNIAHSTTKYCSDKCRDEAHAAAVIRNHEKIKQRGYR